jgi:ubiquitin
MPRKGKLIKKDEGKMIEEKPQLSQEELNSLERR